MLKNSGVLRDSVAKTKNTIATLNQEWAKIMQLVQKMDQTFQTTSLKQHVNFLSQRERHTTHNNSNIHLQELQTLKSTHQQTLTQLKSAHEQQQITSVKIATQQNQLKAQIKQHARLVLDHRLLKEKNVALSKQLTALKNTIQELKSTHQQTLTQLKSAHEQQTINTNKITSQQNQLKAQAQKQTEILTANDLLKKKLTQYEELFNQKVATLDNHQQWAQIWLKNNMLTLESELQRRYEKKKATSKLSWKAQSIDILLKCMELNAPDVAKNRTAIFLDLDKFDNSNLKSRIIGRSGQNVKTFELATGVELIINKSNKVGISAFNPLKRMIAYQALLELVKKDKFSPNVIKKTVEYQKNLVEQEIYAQGKKTCQSLKIDITNRRLLYLIGKLKFRSGYSQEVLAHCHEVALFAGNIAQALDLDVTLARRAGLLHDIGKAIDHESAGNHVDLGVKIATECGEAPVIINAIHAHHGAVPCVSTYAQIVKIADALSAARYGARSNNKADFISRINALENFLKTKFTGVKEVQIYQAGREINIIVDAANVSDLQAELLSGKICNALTQEVKNKGKIIIPGDIDITVLRSRTYLQKVRS